ncbi:hypothetical protein NMG29_38930 [Streptomyces cocklensis]|jgi:hypothetical protein|uniref:Uncharacterized protein n=1 Tax=Actinacidiphila cocklensis TaxID=887465 RepID=A0A9W4GS88_9ACTN|nr:hypothetical protein [Actinacidiphila cocklensis]MDD1064069.1 hypothetical protein [Actinacidiphila cocklensis]CAG6395195.1 conserved hypothetical protein [Actinacidiphila cocklensis]
MSTPQGPQDPRTPHQDGATAPAEPQQPQSVPPQQQQPSGYGQPQGPYVPFAQGPPQWQAQPPAQTGYPYEVRPGYPQPYVPNPNQPDWSAMADRQQADRKGRRRMTIGIATGVVLVLAAAGTLVALTMGKNDDKVADGPKDHPSSSSSTKTSASPSPSGSATGSTGQPTPTLRGSDLFTATKLSVDGQSFARKATSHKTPCWQGTRGGLGPQLDPHHCSQIVLATYVSGKDAVTVGVMVFPTAADAEAVNTDFKGNLMPVTGHGIPDFCSDKVACAVTHAVHGRYLYTTVSGPNSGAAGDTDAQAIAAGRGIAGYALSRLLEMH